MTQHSCHRISSAAAASSSFSSSLMVTLWRLYVDELIPLFSNGCSLGSLGFRRIIASVSKFNYCEHNLARSVKITRPLHEHILSTSVELRIVGKSRTAKRDRIGSRCSLYSHKLNYQFHQTKQENKFSLQRSLCR